MFYNNISLDKQFSTDYVWILGIVKIDLDNPLGPKSIPITST